MRVFAVYQVTMHGVPVFPEFVSRTKHLVERFVEMMSPIKNADEYVIRELNIDLPKYGISRRGKEKITALTKDNIKEVNIIFRSKNGLLRKYTGAEAVKIIKKIKERKHHAKR